MSFIGAPIFPGVSAISRDEPKVTQSDPHPHARIWYLLSFPGEVLLKWVACFEWYTKTAAAHGQANTVPVTLSTIAPAVPLPAAQQFSIVAEQDRLGLFSALSCA